MSVQVAIIGAGPAGLLLGHLLHQAGISVMVLERRSRDYVEGRVRAGVLEQGTVDLLRRLGLDARLRREGLPHGGTKLAVDGAVFRIDLCGLTGGSGVTVYGQQEVMKDLFGAAETRGLPICFEAEDIRPEGLDTARPSIRYVKNGAEHRLVCDFVAG